MSRIEALDPTTTAGAAKPLFDAVQAKLGMVPNLLRTLGNAPVVLESYLQLSGTLAKGSLSARERELLALRISQTNGCDYCLAAHTAIAGSVGVDRDAINDARTGQASNSREQALLAIADQALASNGNLTDQQFSQAVHAGLDHAAILEVVGHIALNTLTNVANHVAQTAIDFPAADELATA